MKTNGNGKRFGEVKMMRESRDQLSREIINMNHAEQKAYLKNLAKKAEVVTKP